MRALVTGAAGFVGSHLARRLLGDGHEVRLLDAFTAYYDPALKRRRADALCAHFPAAELADADLREADLRPVVDSVEVVFHLAAQPGVRTSWGAVFPDYASHNVVGTQRLLEACREGGGISRFVFASSSSVYGDAERHPTPEDARPAPVSPYGVTKLAAEHLVDAYRRSFGIPAVVLRYFTVYGPGQRPDMAFHRFIEAIRTRAPIEIYGDGEQSRDVTYIDDAVAATVAAAEADPAEGRTLNVGGGGVVSVNECIRVLAGIAGHEIDVRHREAVAGDARHTSADLARARDLLDYRPRVGIEEGLRAQWEWHARSAARGG